MREGRERVGKIFEGRGIYMCSRNTKRRKGKRERKVKGGSLKERECMSIKIGQKGKVNVGWRRKKKNEGKKTRN